MFKAHPDFESPNDENEVIRRYISFTKFISLLEFNELYFCRPDQCEDKHEGSLKHGTQYPDFLYEFTKGKIFINCWHRGPYESDAMWRLYGRDGLAIESTFKCLTECFADPGTRRLYRKEAPFITVEQNQTSFVHIGVVKYGLMQNPPTNTLQPYLYKRNAYDHERELRAAEVYSEAQTMHRETIVGLGTAIDPRKLLRRIILPPNHSPSFLVLVKQILQKYSIQVSVESSSLGMPPYFGYPTNTIKDLD